MRRGTCCDRWQLAAGEYATRLSDEEREAHSVTCRRRRFRVTARARATTSEVTYPVWGSSGSSTRSTSNSNSTTYCLPLVQLPPPVHFLSILQLLLISRPTLISSYMSVSDSSRSAVSYWSPRDSPGMHGFVSFEGINGLLSHDGSCDSLLHDGSYDFNPSRSSDQTESADSHSLRRIYVFGTSTSKSVSGHENELAHLDAEIAYGNVGMDIVRDPRGSVVCARTTDGHLGSMLDPPPAQGGVGAAAWVILDQPGTVLPVNPERRPSATLTTSDGTDSQHSASEFPLVDNLPPPPMRRLSSPREARSIESRFSEDLPKQQRPGTPLQWIRKKVKSRSDGRSMKSNPPNSTTVTEPTTEGSPDNSRNQTSASERLKISLSTVVLPTGATKTPQPSTDGPNNHPASGARANSPLPSGPQKETPFLDQVDERLLEGRPVQRIRKFSISMVESARKFSITQFPKDGPSRTTPTEIPPRSQPVPPRVQFIPPRPQSAPTGVRKNTLWNLEFLPSEARGVRTPDEFPVYDRKNIGGPTLPRSKEMRYFNLSDMIQSQPPLEAVGEAPGLLSPKQELNPITTNSSMMHSYPDFDCNAIAPFIEQDQQQNKKRQSAFIAARASFSDTGKKIRRASFHAKNVIIGLPNVSEARAKSNFPQKGAESVTVLGGIGSVPEGIETVPEEVRSGRNVVGWIKRASITSRGPGFNGRNLRRGQCDADLEIRKPAEVVIEEAKRKKRDTGVIGLDPSDGHSSSTDDSYTYTSAIRDIAGLGKRPKGSSAFAALRKAQVQDTIGELVTPAPPGFPVWRVPPGSLSGDLGGGNVSGSGEISCEFAGAARQL